MNPNGFSSPHRVGVFLLLAVALAGCSDDTASIEPQVCPSFTGMTREGVAWTYGPSDSFAGEGWTGEDHYFLNAMSTSTDDGSLSITIDNASTLEQAGLKYEANGSSWYTCDERGLSIRSRHSLTCDVPMSGPCTLFDASYDPPLLFVPSDLHDGSTWSATTTATIQGNTGEALVEARTYDSVATATTITTPAGTFDALDVASTREGSTTHSYLAAVEGTVATDEYVLQEYTP